jgi:hypothetical protein
LDISDWPSRKIRPRHENSRNLEFPQIFLGFSRIDVPNDFLPISPKFPYFHEILPISSGMKYSSVFRSGPDSAGHELLLRVFPGILLQDGGPSAVIFAW